MNALTIVFAQPWAERLGWTLLHFLWQGTAMAVVAAAIRVLLGSAHSRHILACLTLAAMAAAPVVTFGWLGTGGAPSAQPVAAIWDHPAAPGQAAVASSSVQGALPWLVMAWFGGVAVFSARLIGGWLSAARMRYSGARPAPAKWQETLERLARRMRVSRPVQLLVSAHVETPAVVGWLRPVVLAPLGALTGLPTEHVEALLAHELAHITRNDYLINLLQGIAEAVLFYHPAVWWVSRQIRTERELCCDDLAVAASDVLTYARALADLETCRPSRVRAAIAADGGSLLHRIARLLEPSRPAGHTMPGPGAAWALSLLLLLGMGTVAIRGARAEYAPQSGYPTVDRSTIWLDTVKQGDIPILVRGLGILTSPTTVEIKVAETQMKDVKVGQTAKVGFQKSSVTAQGQVTQIRPGAQNGTVTVDVQVHGVPPEQAQALAVVDCTIQIGGLTNVVYVGRPVFHRADTESTVFRIEPDGKQAVRVKVLFGKPSVNLIEIRSGLEPGDQVILSDMSKYDGQDRIYLK